MWNIIHINQNILISWHFYISVLSLCRNRQTIFYKTQETFFWVDILSMTTNELNYIFTRGNTDSAYFYSQYCKNALKQIFIWHKSFVLTQPFVTPIIQHWPISIMLQHFISVHVFCVCMCVLTYKCIWPRYLLGSN